MPPSFRYLGVTFGHRLNVAPHIATLRSKTSTVMLSLTKMGHSTWGIKYPFLARYYTVIFAAIVNYAAGAWADLIQARHVRSLFSLQRSILIRMTKAYSTASTEALQVIACTLPMDLYLQYI